jgi:hypothetical protein
LFWLCGSAGSGKSTIAYTIAQEWSHSGASFFFSKAQLSLRESRLVFQTIAFQLQTDYPILKAQISHALEDRSILTANSETQLRGLILDPISRTQADLPERLVIVIDALDECEDNIITNVVELLATTLEKYDLPVRTQMRFLVTSRPERHLVEFFKERHIPSFDLSAVDPAIRENDVRIFLEDELKKLAASAPHWQRREKEKDIQLLAQWGLYCSTYRHGFCRFREITGFAASKATQRSSFVRTRCRVPASSGYCCPGGVCPGDPPAHHWHSYSFIYSTFETGVIRPSRHENGAF